MGVQKRTVVWWLGCLLNFFVIAVRSVEITDFVSSNTLPDGEVETRIHYKGVSAKETAVAKGQRFSLKFRQLTDGRHFIQLIYDESEVVRDCEYVREKSQISSFLATFKQDLRDLLATSNLTVESLDGKQLPEKIASWFDYTKLKDLCKKKHRELKRALHIERTSHNSTIIENEREISEKVRSKRSPFRTPGTLWCGPSDSALKYTHLGPFSITDKCCRKHDNCRKNIQPYQKKHNLLNSSPFTISHCFCDARQKRDISDLLRIPGTKWCGKGYSATKFTQLGGFSKTDRCCRVHDTSCPFWIGGFENKYGLFNWRVNTLMHCGCDERFRACLKMADTSDANLVGKVFFDIVQTKCFVLKPRKVCIKHSWWGKCLRRKYTKQAVLRDNPRFRKVRF